MTAPTPVWRCAVCETVNTGGTACAACGAVMTRGSRAVNAARARIAPLPPPPARQQLPPPVQRAINREPVDEDEWPYDEQNVRMIPVPGGCIMVSTPRRRNPGAS
ncbi:MAG TPA: hypothetical protein VJN29_04545 [Intrasporangium sp.]|uniref:hypothetical protein n=1 Tax=Intrasporangium sp. TaxID=1925024 RepID=UPI002B48CDA6|nr:hypothetical protein [Intrasporangium sp.]HKX66472.1 hypothetical protein [Intrasporangium sp.]